MADPVGCLGPTLTPPPPRQVTFACQFEKYYPPPPLPHSIIPESAPAVSYYCNLRGNDLDQLGLLCLPCWGAQLLDSRYWYQLWQLQIGVNFSRLQLWIFLWERKRVVDLRLFPLTECYSYSLLYSVPRYLSRHSNWTAGSSSPDSPPLTRPSSRISLKTSFILQCTTSSRKSHPTLRWSVYFHCVRSKRNWKVEEIKIQ